MSARPAVVPDQLYMVPHARNRYKETKMMKFTRFILGVASIGILPIVFLSLIWMHSNGAMDDYYAIGIPLLIVSLIGSAQLFFIHE